VKATGLLCDYAELAGGKLFISGAAINLVGTPIAEPPVRINIALAIMVTIPWNATNQPHRLTVELVADQAGGSQRVSLSEALPPNADPADKGLLIADFNVGRSAVMNPGEDTLMPIALPMLPLMLPQPGSYFFDIKIDGSPMDRVSFRAEVMAPGNMAAFGGP
jgi:Family of unknown function (DUF6941)